LSAPNGDPRAGGTRSAGRRAVMGLCVALAASGCWEQWSDTWWPQMKWQKAVQAFEDTGVPEHPQGFSPPEGTLPVGYPVSPSTLSTAEQEALQNPTPPSLVSL
jgi:hypothetical protein